MAANYRRSLRRVGTVFSCVLVIIACSSHETARPPPTRTPTPAQETATSRTPAATCSYLGAEWLDRPDRDAREQPDKVLHALRLTPDMTVADVGAGTGHFTVLLAKRVKAVHATDLQPEMLRMLDARLAKANITNVTLHRAGDHDAALPAGCCDLVLMVDVYHELADPAAVLAGVRKALKPKGRLVLVEYRGEDPSVPIKPEHKMTVAQVRGELEPLGWTFEQSLEFLPDQHVIVFR